MHFPNDLRLLKVTIVIVLYPGLRGGRVYCIDTDKFLYAMSDGYVKRYEMHRLQIFYILASKPRLGKMYLIFPSDYMEVPQLNTSDLNFPSILHIAQMLHTFTCDCSYLSRLW